MNFDQAFEIIVGLEGKFTRDPRDSGNWTGGKIDEGELRGTKFGISAAAYPHLDIEHLTLNQAKQIYLEDYWMRVRAHELPDILKLAVFDCAINQGVGALVLVLQHAARVKRDGDFGPQTLSACWAAPKRTLIRLLTKRAKRYMLHAKFDLYGDGWLNRLFEIALATEE